MNDFRDRILAGKTANDPLLLSKKPPRPGSAPVAEPESFSNVAISREAVRLANHRDDDRHRLDNESVHIVFEGRTQLVTLINLSGGGAMVEGADGLKLWDRVELRLGDSSSVEAAVRWIRGGRYGLEFAHETRIETGEEELADTLRAVIARSFPDIALDADEGEEEQPAEAPDQHDSSAPASGQRQYVERELRHPLIWSGLVHHDHESISVRLRNISTGGALIECEHALKHGSELLLDLGEAGSLFATVNWARGDMAGLKFQKPYNLQRLAAARPEVASARWVAPDYLRNLPEGNGPWANEWGRSNLTSLQRRLDFLKRP